MTRLRIGTRKSRLALAQTNLVAERLRALDDGLQVENAEFVTTGDRILDRPVHEIGTKGLFTKELDAALLAGEIDLAVHSLKDLAAELPDGLVLASVPEREEPWDCLVAAQPVRFAELPAGARLGTSSLRRQKQLRAARPDLEIAPLRGNLDTRWRKHEAGECEALVLAAAGARRLGWGERIRDVLPLSVSVPAPCQGALAIPARAADDVSLGIARAIEDPRTRIVVDCERSFLATLAGGCSIPAGALAAHGADGGLRLVVYLAELEGDDSLRLEFAGGVHEAVSLGRRAAEEILAGGGSRWLAASRKDTS
jgi:hydroxymethylbilane synthase